MRFKVVLVISFLLFSSCDFVWYVKNSGQKVNSILGCYRYEYAIDSQCSNGEPLVWSRDYFPLWVSTGLDDGGKGVDELVGKAAGLWNEALGHKVFHHTNSLEMSQVIVYSEESTEVGVDTKFYGKNRRPTFVEIRIHNFDLMESEFVKISVLLHELGHVLGLGDSFVSGYIMYPVDINNFESRNSIVFDEGSLKFLKALYKL
jgi:hypothetical protein